MSEFFNRLRIVGQNRDPALWVLLIGVGMLLAGLSTARYAGYNAGMYDLGNMSQAIWSASQGEPLIFTQWSGPESRLGLHVELFYLLLALPYRLWPDPRLLVFLQAALFALGALPVYALALRRTNSRFAARCLALVYLLYPTAQTSVLFDLHGDTLAMPLLLFALDALDRRSWWHYTIFLALALSCKVYVAIPVAGLGAYLILWGKHRRAGIYTLAGALLYGAIAFWGIRLIFSPQTHSIAQVSDKYLSFYFGQWEAILSTLVKRLVNAIVVFGPALLLARHSWHWLLPGVPIAAGVLLSSSPGEGYDYRYHHYALVVPFIIMAAIEGAARMWEQVMRRWRRDIGMTAATVLICNALLVDTPLNPLFWLQVPGRGLDPSAYGITSRDALKDRWLAEQVPEGVPIVASPFVAPHLTNRSIVYLIRYPDEPASNRLPDLLPHVQVALADALFDFYMPVDNGYGGGLEHDLSGIVKLMNDPAFGLVAARDGLLLFERGASPERVLINQLALQPDDKAPAEQTFGEHIALVHHRIEQIGSHRLRVRFTWRLTGNLDRPSAVAVSRLEGIEQARIVHLPTYALLPVSQWPSDQLVVETFDVDLPPETPARRYVWRLGWYETTHPYSYATDPRSLLPNSQEINLELIDIH